MKPISAGRLLTRLAASAGLWFGGATAARAQEAAPALPEVPLDLTQPLPPLFPPAPAAIAAPAPPMSPPAVPFPPPPAGCPSGACAPAPPAAPADGCDRWDPAQWAKVPPVFPISRLGSFIVPPTGPGYYSLRDQLTGNYREAPPRFPRGLYGLNPTSSFDYDYRYLEDPNNTQTDFFDPIKRIHCGDDWMLSFGGEFRFRYENEVNSRLSGTNNDFYLTRTRVYADVWYQDLVRLFGEFIQANTYAQNLPPLAIDQEPADILNLFVDLKLAAPAGHPLYLRVGRQELQYGSQRLVSTLDWANTRRTFEGVKAFWHSDKVDLDAFWVQPVVPDASHLSSVDRQRNFYGFWATYKPKKGTYLDLYYLDLNSSIVATRGETKTIGARAAGDVKDRLLYDLEGMYQTGDRAGATISAFATSTGVGWHFADLPLNPQLWAYFDWASGEPDFGNPNTYGTFNQLFPFGHYYFGFIDDVARQNIQDFNFQAVVNPEPWITALAQYHIFHLDAPKDFLYSAGGAPLRRSPTGAAGNFVGEELDFVVNFHLDSHQDVLIGYSKLFAGGFITNTGTPAGHRSPELFYAQYSFRF